MVSDVREAHDRAICTRWFWSGHNDNDARQHSASYFRAAPGSRHNDQCSRCKEEDENHKAGGDPEHDEKGRRDQKETVSEGTGGKAGLDQAGG